GDGGGVSPAPPPVGWGESPGGARVSGFGGGWYRFHGEYAKAIAGGTSAVMVGSMLAGTEESPGEIELYQGRSFKSYRGNGTLGAGAKGFSDRYFQSEKLSRKPVPERSQGAGPFKGGRQRTISHQRGGPPPAR
ncbi:IMP dehydrogenase, partial [Escherichia coli]